MNNVSTLVSVDHDLKLILILVIPLPPHMQLPAYIPLPMIYETTHNYIMYT